MTEEDQILEEERKTVQAEFDLLMQDYLNSNHRRKTEIIKRAFLVADEAHRGVRRRSGEPYILHPLAVARIVCSEIGLGSTSICAALLHDVVEDTDLTVEDLRKLFGDKIAEIVDGLTKISSSNLQADVSAQSENFRKLLLTMSNDVRVILIKIADRLHNMRTLEYMLPTKQYKITGETMYVYAPLAHRMGLFSIKTELEELCFKFEHPEIYEELAGKLKSIQDRINLLYEHFETPLLPLLDKLGIQYEIKARVKSLFSIWKKMQRKNIDIDQIYDIFAVRIVFEMSKDIDEKKCCWDIYSAITDLYKPRPERLRDWISRPKSNGYQALHLTVMGPDGVWIEIQIRSRRMDDIAERGFAAHWKYKAMRVDEDSELDKWLKTVQEVLENPNPNSIDFLDTIKMNLFSREIFVFTPKGEIISMPQGATALDFAYRIHSNIGDRCLGAKVNYKLVPLNSVLKSGDQVEILTSDTVNPNKSWLLFVTTAKAKTSIEAYLRKERRLFVAEGKKKLEEFLNTEDVSQADLDRALKFFNIAKPEVLFFQLGNGEISLLNVPNNFQAKKVEEKNNSIISYFKHAYHSVIRSSSSGKTLPPQQSEEVDLKKVYALKERFGVRNFIIFPCCNPLPGDDVFGYLNEKNEVEVHKRSCERGLKLKASFGNKILAVKWGDYMQYDFISGILVIGVDEVGIVNLVLDVFLKEKVNISKMIAQASGGMLEVNIEAHIHSIEDIQRLARKLTEIKNVTSVQRIINSSKK